jgi:hypothetical protein
LKSCKLQTFLNNATGHHDTGPTTFHQLGHLIYDLSHMNFSFTTLDTAHYLERNLLRHLHLTGRSTDHHFSTVVLMRRVGLKVLGCRSYLGKKEIRLMVSDVDDTAFPLLSGSCPRLEVLFYIPRMMFLVPLPVTDEH